MQAHLTRRRSRGPVGTGRSSLECSTTCAKATSSVVARLDRLARSTRDLLEIAELLNET